MIEVNLLPPEIKDQVSQSKKNRTASKYLKLVIVIFIIVFAINVAVYLYIDQKLKTVTDNLNQKESGLKQYITVENDAKKLSERLTSIKQIMANSNIWSPTLTEITKLVPDGVFLTNINLDSDQKTRAKITGNALTKKEVSAFSEALKKSNKFSFVDIESSKTVLDPVTKREIETFIVSFSLAKGALK